jgi:DNA-binding NarL/FixJ family response regulator
MRGRTHRSRSSAEPGESVDVASIGYEFDGRYSSVTTMGYRPEISVALGRLEELVRRGLIDVLREDAGFHILASDISEETLADFAMSAEPCVLIVDDSVEQSVLSQIRGVAPRTRVLVYLAQPATRLYKTLLSYIGVQILPTSAPVSEIVAAVAQAGTHDGGAATRKVSTKATIDNDTIGLLSPSEHKVFSLMVHDRTYAAIARTLGISESTAKTHGDRIRRKLNVASKRELAKRVTTLPNDAYGLDS